VSEDTIWFDAAAQTWRDTVTGDAITMPAGPPRWAYNAERHYYRDLRTGRFVAREQVRAWVGESIKASDTATDVLGRLVSNKSMRLDDWVLGMRAEIKREYTRQYLLGKGGMSQLTLSDRHSLGGLLRKQYAHLQNFAADIKAGKLSEVADAA